jgi:tetratricopeptide (TPR) repeat protein
MSGWLPVVTAIIGAAVAAGGFMLSGWRQRQETLDTRIERAVKSQIGDRFMDFLAVGERTAREMSDLTEAASVQAEAVISEAKDRLAQLEASMGVQRELEDLLTRADKVLPDLDTLAAATPAALLRDLNSSQIDAPQATASLLRLLDHGSTTSKQFEMAGDKAREHLEDIDLARALYQRAVDRNPSNVSAKAELLGTTLLDGDDEASAAAMDGLRALVRDNPVSRTPLIKLLNEYVRSERYADMEQEIRSILESSPDDALLWRNLAVALVHNGGTVDDIGAAYERAIELSNATTNEGDYVNSAKTYVGWLASQGLFERADQILAAALAKMPQEESLYFASFQLDMRRGHRDRARRALEIMAKIGGPNEALFASQLQLGLDSLDYLDNGESELADPLALSPELIHHLIGQTEAEGLEKEG